MPRDHVWTKEKLDRIKDATLQRIAKQVFGLKPKTARPIRAILMAQARKKNACGVVHWTPEQLAAMNKDLVQHLYSGYHGIKTYKESSRIKKQKLVQSILRKQTALTCRRK